MDIERGDVVLRPFLASCDRTALRQLANTLIPYGLLWWVAIWCQGQAPQLLPLVIAVQVLFLGRCFSLMHDTGHGSLFRRPAANRIAGFLFGIVCGLPQLPWSRGHAFHHRHNGDWELYQGPASVISTESYRSLSSPRQRLYRWLRHPLMLAPAGFFYLVIKPRLTLLQALAGLVGHAVSSLQRSPSMAMGEVIATYRSRHWHSLEEGLDLILNNLAVIGLWLLMGFAIGPGRFWMVYAPVMAGSAAIFLCLFFVQHNFPDAYAHRTRGWDPLSGNLEGTSDLHLPALLNWFSADIGCHAIHHLCSAIPNYRLRDCQRRNAHLLQGVTRLGLADLSRCFAYILWDPELSRLTTAAEL
ncbi:fatty acid desaturase [Synechococcus sp. GFB01]|nr:fatty acid desaturase [Synechococcus sp. GFB01]